MRCYDDSFNRYCERRWEAHREWRLIQHVECPSPLVVDEMFGPNPLLSLPERRSA